MGLNRDTTRTIPRCAYIAKRAIAPDTAFVGQYLKLDSDHEQVERVHAEHGDCACAEGTCGRVKIRVCIDVIVCVRKELSWEKGFGIVLRV